MTDLLWGEAVSLPVVPYPEMFSDVLAGKAYWYDEPLLLVGPQDTGVRYVRDYRMPVDAGQPAWRRHDPAHPRCWYCGKFLNVGRMKHYTTGCPDCGEWTGGPW